MHALKTLAAAVAVSLTMSACAAGGASNGDARLPDGPHASRLGTASTAAPTTVRVTNYNWMDVVVYAVQGNSRVRLGQVTTMSNASFRLPVRMVSNGVEGVRLMVDPVGSTQGWQTERLGLQAGEQVQFNVQNSLQFSTVLVAR